MYKKLAIQLLISSSLASGCRYFQTEATIHIQALNGEGQPLPHAKVVVNKVPLGKTDERGVFKGNVELPIEEPLLVEVSKASTATFYAPFFETIRLKRGDMNTFKLKATLYGVARDKETVASLPDPIRPEAVAPEGEPAADAAAPQVLEVGNSVLEPQTTPLPKTDEPQVVAIGSFLTFYVVSGRDPVDNASIYFGDAQKKQWVHGCYTNSKGRCSFSLLEPMDSAVILVRAKGYQTQTRSFSIMDGDKVRFEMNRGHSLEVFAISPNQGQMEGIEGVRVSFNGKALGSTDRFGSFIEPLAAGEDTGGKVLLEADSWLPAKVETVLSPPFHDSVIQHFQNVKPIAPKLAVMDFVNYRQGKDAPVLNAPSLETLESALAQAGAQVINGPVFQGKLAERKLSLNDLNSSNWSQVRKIGEPLHYILRPSFIEGPQARIILSAIDLEGRMVYSASQSVRAKGSTQAVLKELASRLIQNIKHEGAITDQVGDEFRINLGRNHGMQVGDKVQITGNMRLATGEISAWDAIGTAQVTEAAPERSRIKLIQSLPNARVETGNLVSLDRSSAALGDSVNIEIREEQTQSPIGLAEIYTEDTWLGATNGAGQAKLAEIDLLKAKEVNILSPGFAPKNAPLPSGSKALLVAMAHEATPIQIETQPAGALVKINGRDLGRTPIDTEIPYPGPKVNIEIGGVDGFEYITRAQSVGNRGIVLRGATAVTLGRDPQHAARILAAEGKLEEACQLLESIPETDDAFLLAQHQLGEIYLNQLHEPVKAATAFHKVTTHSKAESYKDKRFIGTYINEAVALFQAGEKAAKTDSNLAISYWRQSEAILSRTEDQLRFVPQAQYNQAVHTLSYYRALSLHKAWTITQNAQDQEHAIQHWKDYIQGTALALPQDQHYEWVKKAEGYFQQIQTARNKPRVDNRSPVAM